MARNSGSQRRAQRADSSSGRSAAERSTRKRRNDSSAVLSARNVALVVCVCTLAVLLAVYQGSAGGVYTGQSRKSAKGVSKPRGHGFSKHVLTPEFVSAILERHYDEELARHVPRPILDRAQHLQAGIEHLKRRQWHNATRQFRYEDGAHRR